MRMMVTQVDVVLGTGSVEFHQRTLRFEQVVRSKARESPPLSFVGVQIFPLPPGFYILHHPTYGLHLRLLQIFTRSGRFSTNSRSWGEEDRT